MKKIVCISILILLIIMLLYVICLIDTNSVVVDFEDSIRNQTVTNTALDRYLETTSKTADYEVELHRRFVIHNFNKGVMYVNYTLVYYNDSGEMIRGSWNVDSKWDIEKKHNHWIVVSIDEEP